MSCPICEILKHEKVEVIDTDYFVCDVKDKKGHYIRKMICSIEHKPHRRNHSGMQVALGYGLKYLKQPFVILFGENASIKEHWHVILCDRNVSKETVNIYNEPRIEVFQ